MILGLLDIDYQSYILNIHSIYNEIRLRVKREMILCPNCNGLVSMHGCYKRKVIFSEYEIYSITIIQVRCRKCKRVHAIIPPFVTPKKHYASYLIENALYNYQSTCYCNADESTIRRWKVSYKLK